MKQVILYPIVNYKEWAKKYGIQIDSYPCEKCGKILTPNIPFASGEWRGLRTEEHECGPKYVINIAVTTNNEYNEKLKEIFEEMEDL